MSLVSIPPRLEPSQSSLGSPEALRKGKTAINKYAGKQQYKDGGGSQNQAIGHRAAQPALHHGSGLIRDTGFPGVQIGGKCTCRLIAFSRFNFQTFGNYIAQEWRNAQV